MYIEKKQVSFIKLDNSKALRVDKSDYLLAYIEKHRQDIYNIMGVPKELFECKESSEATNRVQMKVFKQAQSEYICDTIEGIISLNEEIK